MASILCGCGARFEVGWDALHDGLKKGRFVDPGGCYAYRGVCPRCQDAYREEVVRPTTLEAQMRRVRYIAAQILEVYPKTPHDRAVSLAVGYEMRAKAEPDPGFRAYLLDSV